MQSARGWSQLEKRAKEAEGARRGMTRRSSWEGSMLGDARMQLLKPCEQACMSVGQLSTVGMQRVRKMHASLQQHSRTIIGC